MDQSVTIYTYAGCSTCRDATAWLAKHEIAFVEKPIRETPPSVAELELMLKYYDGELKRLFNTSGLEYKALGMADKLAHMTAAEALRLLSKNGKLVKRPFLLGPKVGLLGFKPERWKEALT
jgi:arsenate reductase (glutaredoxin)